MQILRFAQDDSQFFHTFRVPFPQAALRILLWPLRNENPRRNRSRRGTRSLRSPAAFPWRSSTPQIRVCSSAGNTTRLISSPLGVATGNSNFSCSHARLTTATRPHASPTSPAPGSGGNTQPSRSALAPCAGRDNLSPVPRRGMTTPPAGHPFPKGEGRQR